MKKKRGKQLYEFNDEINNYCHQDKFIDSFKKVMLLYYRTECIQLNISKKIVIQIYKEERQFVEYLE